MQATPNCVPVSFYVFRPAFRAYGQSSPYSTGPANKRRNTLQWFACEMLIKLCCLRFTKEWSVYPEPGVQIYGFVQPRNSLATRFDDFSQPGWIYPSHPFVLALQELRHQAISLTNPASRLVKDVAGDIFLRPYVPDKQ
jgi:hypothetical protein